MADNTGHLSQHKGGKPAAVKDEGVHGPVPMHHRLKLGIEGLELQRNPFGDGAPSKKSTIANGGRKGW